MTNDLEVIAAFADGERVEPDALKRALASDEGRQYLVDIVALREVTADEVEDVPSRSAQGRIPYGWGALAAGVLLAVAGAYQAGAARAASGSAGPTVTLATPGQVPPPTVVIKLAPGSTWHDSTGGRP